MISRARSCNLCPFEQSCYFQEKIEKYDFQHSRLEDLVIRKCSISVRMLSNGVDSLGRVRLEIFKNRLEKHLLKLIGQYKQHILPSDR